MQFPEEFYCQYCRKYKDVAVKAPAKTPRPQCLTCFTKRKPKQVIKDG